jgi:glycosyltransferase involved in cell wall biosynthesis
VHRIVIDARSIVAKKSGIGNYTEALIRHLVPLAAGIRFLLLRHPSASQPLLRHERVEELVFKGETKSAHTVFRLGRSHPFEDFDLYHSPGDLVPLGLRCPWVVTLHDLMWVEAPRLASAFLPERLVNSLWYRANFSHAVRGARRVIAISHATADALARVYPRDAHKVRVVYHGIEHSRYAAELVGSRALIERWVPSGKRYSLIVGQGSPYKNHVGMVRAFVEATRAEPDHLLVLVRRFTRVDSEIKKLLARDDVKQKVVVLPFVSDTELLALYRYARMLLFASHYEGFGLPALEAMCLGTPVLGSSAPAVLEVTGDAALHPDPANHSKLVLAMRELDRDEALRRHLIEAGQRRVKDFSWQQCAKETLGVYRAALARGQR